MSNKNKKKKSRVSAGLIVLLVLVLIATALLVYIIKLVWDNSKSKNSSKTTTGGTTSTVETAATDTGTPIAITLKSDSITAGIGQTVTADDFIDYVECETEYTTGVVADTSVTPADATAFMTDSLSFDAMGTYEIYVVAEAADTSFTLEKVSVIVGDGDYSAYLNSVSEVTVPENTDFSEYSAEVTSFGYSEDYDEDNRPTGCAWYAEQYGKYACDFIQPKSEYVYLTMDESYENGLTESILDTLKSKGVKCVFFVSLNYAKNNPDLIQRMIDEGHIIGNHTSECPSGGIAGLSAAEQLSDMKAVNDYFKETYNYDIYLFRFPEGSFSEQGLAVAQSLGMRSVFWSFTYQDWDTENQPEVSTALDNAVSRLHGGAIYLLRASSATNAAMLGDFIDKTREAGYEFGYYAKMN